MYTKLITIEQYKSMFTEMLLNKTSAITKISDGSAVNAIAFGAAKLAQKANKDIAVLESHMFADSAVNTQLDDIARLNGVSQRFGNFQSSTYVRVVGTPGTVYTPGSNVFYSSTGIIFDPESAYTITGFGYGYIKVRSRTSGSNTQVDALTINRVVPAPAGHQYCINEYLASFGADREIDDVYRKRIKEGSNFLGRSTVSQLEQVFMKINQNVLKVYFGGIDEFGRLILMILTQNGIDLNSSEINDILLRSEKFFSLSELRPTNYNGYGITLVNMNWQPIDISARVLIDSSFSIDDVRKDIQIRVGKYLDYRYWKMGAPIEWDDLLNIVKFTNGVKYVNDAYFYPNTDVQTDLFALPRIRGFQLLDLNGNILQDLSGNLNPIYYPADTDFSFQASVLQSI